MVARSGELSVGDLLGERREMGGGGGCAVDGDEGTAGVGDDAIKLGARVGVADVGLREPSVELVPRVLDDG